MPALGVQQNGSFNLNEPLHVVVATRFELVTKGL
jgi:hypothetical protein